MKSKEKNLRNIKVKKVYDIGFERMRHSCVYYPEIRLAGKWLQDFGFKAGDILTLECNKNQIVIKKV